MTGMTNTIITIVYSLAFSIGFLFSTPAASGREPEDFAQARERMVKEQLEARGISDPAVLAAMRRVPRHLFVPPSQGSLAYGDFPLPIGEGQTISQPYVVAFMTEALALKSDHRVLEIGTGSGYQAAVLGELVKDVYTVEIIEKLGEQARKTLIRLGYGNVHVKIGDGYAGWPKAAPFDAVIVTCAPEAVPPALVDQLREGGKMIIPVGARGGVQRLEWGVKKNGRLKTENTMYVRFVPMVRKGE